MGSKIKQNGIGNKASVIESSPVTRGANNNVNMLTKTKTKYFFSGLIVSITAAIIFEFILKGKISTILIRLASLIKTN